MHGIQHLLARALPPSNQLPKIKVRPTPQPPLGDILADPPFEPFGYVGDETFPWQEPQGYVRWVPPSDAELHNQVEYDMDEQDWEWLQLVNAERRKAGGQGSLVAEEVFEIIMDRLEKEWFDLVRRIPCVLSHLTSAQTSRIPKPSHAFSIEDSTCAICDSDESEGVNAIVFCDGCNLAVHQDCYGVPYIPEGQWLCRKCTVSPDRPVSCMLCPVEAGAFKQTTNGGWAHLLCAIFVPEVGVSNTVYMEPVDGIECVPKSRWKLTCYLCRQKGGAPIQCSKKSCFAAFHVTCAREYGLTLELRRPSDDAAVHKGYCHRHPPDLEEEPATPKPVGRPPLGNQPKRKETAIAFPKRIKPAKRSQAYTRSFVSTGPPVVPQAIFDRIDNYVFQHIKIRRKHEFLTSVCRYWSLKRESRRNASLLKRLHLEPWTAAATAREHTEAERELKMKMMNVLKTDMDKVASLTDLVAKREQTKLEQALLLKQIIKEVLYPLGFALQDALKRIRDLDRDKLFLRVPSREAVPDYLDVISHPMSWEIIAGKIDTAQYASAQSFEDDVRLVCYNAMKYNLPDTAWHKQAKLILKRTDSIFPDILSKAPVDMTDSLQKLLTPESVDSLFTLNVDPLPAAPRQSNRRASSAVPESEAEAQTPPTKSTKKSKSRATPRSDEVVVLINEEAPPRRDRSGGGSAKLLRDIDPSHIIQGSSRSGSKRAQFSKPAQSRTRPKNPSSRGKRQTPRTSIKVAGDEADLSDISSELSSLSEIDDSTPPIVPLSKFSQAQAAHTPSPQDKVVQHVLGLDQPLSPTPSDLTPQSDSNSQIEDELTAATKLKGRPGKTPLKPAAVEDLPFTAQRPTRAFASPDSAPPSRSKRKATDAGLLTPDRHARPSKKRKAAGTLAVPVDPSPELEEILRQHEAQPLHPRAVEPLKEAEAPLVADSEPEGESDGGEHAMVEAYLQKFRKELGQLQGANHRWRHEFSKLQAQYRLPEDKRRLEHELVWASSTGYWPAEVNFSIRGDEGDAERKAKERLAATRKEHEVTVEYFGRTRTWQNVSADKLWQLGESPRLDAMMLLSNATKKTKTKRSVFLEAYEMAVWNMAGEEEEEEGGAEMAEA